LVLARDHSREILRVTSVFINAPWNLSFFAPPTVSSSVVTTAFFPLE